MNYKIIALYPFERELKRLGKKYHSIRDDYAALLKELHANPALGTHLGGNIRKVRMAIGSKGRGKSHGARVITVTISVDMENAEINLLFIYDRAERENISAKEIKALIKEVGLGHVTL